MRHFFGLLLGVVVAAALLVGGGWASQEAVRGAVQNVDPVRDTRMLIALGVMVVVGLLLGLVLVTRVSPLSTFVPSMALLAWTVVYLLDVSRAASLVPTGPSVHAELLQAGRGALTLLSTGVYALLGIALFLPVLMPSRWSRPEREEEEEYEESLGY